jgi:V/A-type H+-transporting ATPase subunit I
MHNATVVCLGKDREAAVRRLQDLGTLHVVNLAAGTGETTAETQRLAERYQTAIARLAARKPPEGTAPETGSAPDILAAFETSLRTIADSQEKITAGHRALARLAPWGSFSREDIDRLDAAGYRLALGSAGADSLPELPPEATLHEISRSGNTVHFAVVAPASLELDFHEVPFPEKTDADAIRADIRAAEAAGTEAEQRLDRLAAAVPALRETARQTGAELAFHKAVDGMGQDEQLAWLQGYIPERALPALADAAAKAGWALRHVPAGPDDPNVPTFIDYDRFGLFRIAKPLFDFIGIAPAYNENDVSVCVLLFLTLFFGMIIGDAAYGTIFLAIGFYARSRITDPRKKVAAGLFILLSAAALVWGALNGTWFAIPKTSLPALMRGFAWFDGEPGQKHIQWLCFFVAALHLSLGRAWKAWIRRDLAALGHLGWGLLIWGNFFTAVELVVSKNSFPLALGVGLYGVGTALILAFGVKWRNVGEVLNLPFGFIGSFVDVLSYIRLFAVGLSSYYIAQSFNDMGRMVLELSPWLLPAAAVVIVFGHLLNIALGFMGVLVHGIRLNTLEFSNHMELTWSGKPYHPLHNAESN